MSEDKQENHNLLYPDIMMSVCLFVTKNDHFLHVSHEK